MSKAKILVVEDNPDLRRALCLRLRASGYDVVQAEDGVGAVSTAVRELPDLVVLDIGMPGGDGVSVLDRYANLPALSITPVIVLTAKDTFTTEPMVRKYAIAAFLTKPVDHAQLLSAIEVALHTEPEDAVAR
jgi:DNA-binding response OmpR family regulator